MLLVPRRRILFAVPKPKAALFPVHSHVRKRSELGGRETLTGTWAILGMPRRSAKAMVSFNGFRLLSGAFQKWFIDVRLGQTAPSQLPAKRPALEVIRITHSMPDVSAAIDRVIVLDRGRKAADKKTADMNRTELVQRMLGALADFPAQPRR